MENLIIRCVDLPYCTNGYVDIDPDGDYNVYINSRLSFDRQRKTLIHERYQEVDKKRPRHG